MSMVASGASKLYSQSVTVIIKSVTCTILGSVTSGDVSLRVYVGRYASRLIVSEKQPSDQSS